MIERWHDADGRTQTTTGELLEINAPHRLRLTWQDADWPTATNVELRLEQSDGATRVRLRHEGWERLGDDDSLRAAHVQGWGMHLANLKRYVEEPRL